MIVVNCVRRSPMRAALLVLLTTLLIPGISLAQTTGSIAGTVTREDGVPIPGAVVQAGSEQRTTATDGTYRFDALPPGFYNIQVFAETFVPELFDNHPCAGHLSDSFFARCPMAFSNPVQVSAGSSAVANFALAPDTAIRGNVTDLPTGAPMASGPSRGYAVSFYDASGQFVASRALDSAGHYYQRLPAGRYYIRFRVGVGDATHFDALFGGHPCVAADCTVLSGTPIDLADRTTATADFAAPRGGAIAGTVRRTPDNAPLFAYIELYNAAGSAVWGPSARVTESNGTFLSQSLAPGTYYARATSTSNDSRSDGQLFSGISCPRFARCPIVRGTPITVTADQTTAGIDFLLSVVAPAASGSISGRVTTDTGTGSPFAFLTARLGAGAFYNATANAEGVYTLTGLPDGTYTVEARGGFTYVPQTRTVTVSGGGATSGIDFQLVPGGSIEGTITRLLPAVTPPYPTYTSGTEIHAYDMAGIERGVPASSSTPNGYRITGLPAGQYFVAVKSPASLPSVSPARPGGGDMIGELFHETPCVSFDCDVTRGTPVAVTLGATTTGVDFTLEFGGSIAGNRPAGTRVEVYDTSGRLLTRRTRNQSFKDPNDQRFYEAVGLPSGYYYLRLHWDGGSLIYPDILCDTCSVTDGTPIFVRVGERTHAHFNVTVTPRAVRGTVRDAATGLPLSTIAVELYGASGNIAATALTDELGAYTLATVRPGTYYARTQNTRGYIDERFNNLSCAGCDITGSTPITMGTADLSGIDFLLSAGVIVRGTVTTDGFPASGIQVPLFDSTGSPIERPVSDTAGSFLAAVPAATYFARTEPKTGFRSELYRERACPQGTCDPTSGDPIAATADVAGVDFTLASCSVSLAPGSTLATGIAGFPYRQPFAASGGTGPYRYVVTSGTLPPGLSLDPATGLVSGTPTAGASATITISVTDAAGCALVRTYILTIETCSSSVQLDASIATPAVQPIDRGRDWIAVPASGGVVIGHLAGTCGFADTIAAAAVSASWLRVRGPSTAGGTATADFEIEIDPNPSTTLFRTGHVFLGGDAIQVRQAPIATAAPFGLVETPADGAVVTGSIAVSGWVLDDLGISRVRIYRDPVSPEQPGVLVYIADGVFVQGARPDVEAAYRPYPNSGRAGWGYLLLTNVLPNRGTGDYRLYVYADDADGHTVFLGTRRIVGDNANATAPFGAIDTPGQGQTIGGANYVNFGWALTPQPKIIPMDGSTIQVYIDGVPVGTVDYNHYRSDVSTTFPGLANSDGPVGFRMLDTTTLSDGMHTIGWTVFDNQGVGAGVGSRFFNVQNTGVSSALAGADAGRQAGLLADAQISTVRASVRRDSDPRARLLQTDDNGARHLRLRVLDRLELDLSAVDESQCAWAYAGYEVVGGELRRLPAGATLDASGIFYWHPGPAFLGRYELLFVRTACDGTRERVPVTVSITSR